MITNIRVEKDQTFKLSEGKNLLADVYLPVTESPRAFPALILIHGGAWQAGSKEMYQDWGPYLAENGLAAMSIDYRLSSKNNPTWPGVMEDVRDAYKWLVANSEHYHIDTSRIGAMGDSCGAQLALLLALDQPGIKSVVSVYGVYDVAAWWKYTQVTRDDDPVGNLFGKTPSQAPELYKEASPTEHISRFIELNDFNCLMLWGEQDTIVPAKQSRDFFAQLAETPVNVEKLVIPDKGHFWFTIFPGIPGGTLKDEPNRNVAPQVLEFIRKTL
ncbi:alpha/beta hydrolase [Mesobacillus selenatarsenatis]|uniref:Alpha/beta hydrolase n=1 Tax=Mesobacillus selenatarsenatis TaxID=388741 RepID=A0A846TZN6_9BACI|nr:alpha/beta hydrolase [Mesobacillus selenatarsenatis]NKE07066.1 alpha/beta hydrolase [Mesobacillus selenatarsenatis]